jgi:hypothetical protein
LIEIFTKNNDFLKFTGIITDDSPLSSSIYDLLKKKYKKIQHIKDYKDLIKNMRNCILDKKKIHVNNEKILFNLRDLIQIIHECDVNINSIFPFDKMDENLVKNLLTDEIINTCIDRIFFTY